MISKSTLLILVLNSIIDNLVSGKGIDSENYSVKKQIIAVTNQALSFSNQSNFDQPRIALYQILQNSVQIIDINDDEQSHNFTGYKDERPIKFISWSNEELYLFTNETLQIRSTSKNYKNISYVNFDHNSTASTGISFSNSNQAKFIVNFKDLIQIYSRDNVIDQILIENSTANPTIDYKGQYIYYTEYSDSKQTQLNIYSISKKQIAQTIKISSNIDIITQIPIDDSSIMLIHDTKDGIRVIKDQKLLTNKFKDTQICQILTFSDQNTLLCSLFNGSVFVWNIDYQNLQNSYLIQQIVIENKNIQRIIYVTGKYGLFAIYTQQFNIYVMKQAIFSSTTIFIFVGLAIVALIAAIGVLVYFKKKRKAELQYDQVQAKEKQQYDYLKS